MVSQLFYNNSLFLAKFIELLLALIASLSHLSYHLACKVPVNVFFWVFFCWFATCLFRLILIINEQRFFIDLSWVIKLILFWYFLFIPLHSFIDVLFLDAKLLLNLNWQNILKVEKILNWLYLSPLIGLKVIGKTPVKGVLKREIKLGLILDHWGWLT